MEIRIREDFRFGFVVSTWLHGQVDGPRFDFDPSDKEVRFTWKYPDGVNYTRLPITIENRESLAEINIILEDEFSQCDTKIRYLVPLVNEAFLVARDQGYFDHLDEDLVCGLMRGFGYNRSWFTCYGFLALGLPLEVIELLVPPILLSPDLPAPLRPQH